MKLAVAQFPGIRDILSYGERHALRMRRLLRALRVAAGVLKALFCALLVCVIAASCVTIVSALLHPDRLPTVFGYQAMAVRTGSMRPLLAPGDLAVVRVPARTDDLTVGTIVTYLDSSKVFVTHRIAAVERQNGALSYVTKGDANPVADVSPVVPGSIAGVYVAHVPFLGYVSLFFQSRLGLLLLVLAPAAALLGAHLWTRLRSAHLQESR